MEYVRSGCVELLGGGMVPGGPPCLPLGFERDEAKRLAQLGKRRRDAHTGAAENRRDVLSSTEKPHTAGQVRLRRAPPSVTRTTRLWTVGVVAV